MECAFLKVANHKACQAKPTKRSIYCKLHNEKKVFNEKKVKLCLVLIATEALMQDIKYV